MKYSEEIIIESPIDTVISLYDNPEYYPRWMDGMQKFELLEGEANQPGSKATYNFKMGKREIEMTETITKRNLPDIITREYDSKGVFNIQSTRFEVIDSQTTRVIAESEFQFDGFLMKMMAFLMPGAFKKQTRKILHDFKEFVDDHQSNER